MEKLAVCASGTGSLFESIIEAEVPVFLFVTDRICRAVQIAKKHGIPVEIIERRNFKEGKEFDRRGFTKALTNTLLKHEIDLVALVGFMTVLSPAVFDHYDGKIINTHPSLLPKHKGGRAVEDALNSGDEKTGFTLHIATEKLDDGPILVQEEVPIFPDDTVEVLHERIKEKERAAYPKLLKKKLGLE